MKIYKKEVKEMMPEIFGGIDENCFYFLKMRLKNGTTKTISRVKGTNIIKILEKYDIKIASEIYKASKNFYPASKSHALIYSIGHKPQTIKF